MKRSNINKYIREASELLNNSKFYLPGFSEWTYSDWDNISKEYLEIIDNSLGWDVTDFGSSDFENTGLLLFTLRNGNINNIKYKKKYAEKVLIVKENQVTPFHYHLKKMEDIINRGGGNLVIQIYNSDQEGRLDEKTKVQVSTDGKNNLLKPGAEIILGPGESITLHPGLFHSFWGEVDKGTVIVGEVSQTNDDHKDNFFLNKQSRFSKIEEDEEPVRLLVNDYDQIKLGKS